MKRILRGFFSIPAFVLLSGYHLRRLIFGEEKAFMSLVERLSRYTGFVGVYLRSAVYSRVLASCSPELQIGFGTVFTKPKAVVGKHVYVGRYCSLGWVHVEKDVMLADYVAIPSGGATHSLEPGVPPRERENSYRCVHIGEGSWVGTNAVVLADIGKYCVVGAGAVVTKPIPDYSVAVGVPAKVISTARAEEVAEAARNR